VNRKFFLIFIFIISFLVRVLFFIVFLQKDKNCWVCTDSAEYHSIAVNIAQGEGIKTLSGELNFRRLPGYPFFLASLYKFFANDVNKVLWLQVLISSFIPVLIFYLSLLFFPSSFLLAKITSLFSAFNLGFVLYSKKIFWAGILLGTVSLIRPVGHYLLLISVFLLLLSSLNFIKNIKASFLFFGGWLLIVSWWLLRNWMLTGYLFFHTLPGIHFLIYSAAYVDMEQKECEYNESRIRLLKEWDEIIKKEEKSTGRSLADIQNCYIAQKLALDYIKKDSLSFMKHSFLHMFKTCFGLHSSTLLFFDSKSLPIYDKNTTFFDKVKRFLFPSVSNKFIILLIYLEILFFIFITFGFLGFFLMSFFRFDLLCILLKILPFIWLFIFITLAYGCARLRLAIEPFLIILSFNFWIEFLKRRISERGN